MKTLALQHDDALTPEQVDQAYDSPPWWYDVRGFFILCLSYQCALWSQVRFFARNLTSGRHLEVAVGTGTLFSLVRTVARLLGARPQRVVGFDYASSMLAGARARLRRAEEVTLLRADIADLNLPSASFDTANIANALHCLPDVDAGLREVSRVLKPGARLALNALLEPTGPLAFAARRINAWGTRKGILKRPFTDLEVRAALARAGFTIETAARTGNVLNVVATRRR